MAGPRADVMFLRRYICCNLGFLVCCLINIVLGNVLLVCVKLFEAPLALYQRLTNKIHDILFKHVPENS